MTPLDIVEADARKNHPDTPIEDVLYAFSNACYNPDVTILQHEESLLVLSTDGDFHFINATRMQDFVTNVKILLGHAKELGFHEIHTDFTNPKIIEVAKQAGVDFTVQQTSENYMMTVRL